MREVTLDNQPLDISGAQAPAIIFNNPIFTDISTMKANRTSTYTLPLSEHNKKVIGLLNELDIDNDYMRRLHVLDEFRDGFNIIPKASTKILRVTPENIEMSCVWGSIKSVASELGSLNIQELTEETLIFGEIPYIENDTQKVGLLYLQTFKDNVLNIAPEDINIYHYPSMRCDRVLEKIQEKCSVPIRLAHDVASEWAKYWVPCITNNHTETTRYANDAVLMSIGTNMSYPGTLAPYKHKIQLPVIGSTIWADTEVNIPTWTVDYDRLGMFYTRNGYRVWETPSRGPLHFRLNIDAIANRAYLGRILVVRIEWQDKYNETTNNRIYNYKIGSTNSVSYVIEDDIEVINGRFDSSMAYIRVSFMWDSPDSEKLTVGTSPGSIIHGEVTLRVWAVNSGTVALWEPFPVMKNLPNMSCVDFLKNMMWLTGAYPTTTLNGEVEIKSLSSIMPSIGNAIPLDSKLTYRRHRERSFTYGSYAKRNWMRWADDDTVSVDANGYFDIADDTLEKEHDIFKLAFAPSDSGAIAALVPIYNYVQKEDSTWEVVKVTNLKPRLVKRSELPRAGYTYYTGEFTYDMSFQTLIPVTYDLYLRLLTNTNACKVMFSMTPSEISQFNEDTIFYFNGMHWMQIQTNVDGDGVATSDMLQVTVHQKPTR